VKNKISDLRNHLFETIERLKDPEDPMDVKTAGAIKDVGQTIINSAKVELEAMEMFGAEGSGFIPMGNEEKLPRASTPRLVLSNKR
jgi:hypothetical protein